jgi:hypothetical protein
MQSPGRFRDNEHPQVAPADSPETLKLRNPRQRPIFCRLSDKYAEVIPTVPIRN